MIELINLANVINVRSPSLFDEGRTVETIAAAQAKTHFGELLEKVQREPVTISRNGRAVAVLMSATAFEELQRLKLQLLRQEVRKGLDDLESGKLVSAEHAFAAVDKELES